MVWILTLWGSDLCSISGGPILALVNCPCPTSLLLREAGLRERYSLDQGPASFSKEQDSKILGLCAIWSLSQLLSSAVIA